MYTPYTYLLKCIPTGKLYYGVRWAIGCHPNDLWTTYFSSSKYVKSAIDTYGKESFVFEIRKTFKNKKEAQNWEHRCLRRLDAANRNDFINRHDGFNFGVEMCWVRNKPESKLIPIYELESYIKIGWNRGRIFSDEHKKKNSNSCKKRLLNSKSNSKGKPWTEAQKKKLSLIMTGKKKEPMSDEWKRSISSATKGKTKNNKPFTHQGIRYDSLKTAKETTGKSRWLLLQDGGVFTP